MVKKMTAKYRLGGLHYAGELVKVKKIKFLHNFTFCIQLKFKLARHEMNISSKLLFAVLIANGSPRNMACFTVWYHFSDCIWIA